MEFSKQLTDEIWEYCRLNKITNMDEFMEKLMKTGFTIEKYGSAPAGFNKEPKEKIVEKVVEKIVEKPVERIVEKVVEVPVEKEVYITDDTKTNELLAKISSLETTLEENEVKYKENNKNQTQTILRLNKEKDLLKEEHQKEIDDLKKQLEGQTKTKRDIYDDDTNGSFGSNLLDR